MAKKWGETGVKWKFLKIFVLKISKIVRIFKIFNFENFGVKIVGPFFKNGQKLGEKPGSGPKIFKIFWAKMTQKILIFGLQKLKFLFFGILGLWSQPAKRGQKLGEKPGKLVNNDHAGYRPKNLRWSANFWREEAV